MKKKVIGVIAVISLFATVGYANNFMEGLGFVAPAIIGKGNIFQPQTGEIVYDQIDSTFYGHDHNGQWQAFGGAGAGSPTGVITAFAGVEAPAGFLICDGSPVSRTTYAGLFAVIGESFGAGDGVNTFNLPDLRGRFLRGLDGEAGNDPDKGTRVAMAAGGNIGNNIGSVQADENKSHTHNYKVWGAWTDPVANMKIGAGNPSVVRTASQSDGILASGGAESRPKNVYVNYIIKI